MIEGLERWAAERGYRVGWCTPDVVAAVREEVAGRHASGELDEELFRSELSRLDGGDRGTEERWARVVVVVKPRPAHRVSFDLGERWLDAIIPPTYVRYRPLFEELRQDLQANALPGARVEQLVAPLKPLAARLGLVRYGRNNVTYAPGVGSYLQLLAYLTDAALPLADCWRPREPELLAECETCGACRAACPTGAIGDDRVLLYGQRCLTRANETPGPWPDWVPATAHHCLIGCLECQRCCPANPELQVECTGVAFTREETRALLEDVGERVGPAWDGVRARLQRLGQSHEEPVLGRNLRALLGTLSPGA